MRNLVALVAGGVAMISVGAGAHGESRSVRIAQKGAGRCTIAIPAHPSPSERLAAEDLARYVEQMSGAHLPVQEGGDLPPRVLVVSERSNLGGWLPDQPKVDEDAYAILVRDSRVFLVGGRGRSTLYAVYDLLSRLGCRWLAPKFSHYQGASEYIPKRDTLTVRLPSILIEKPAFTIRKMDIGEGVSHTTESIAQMIEWMMKLRFNTLVIPYDQHGAGRAKWDNWREKIAPELQSRDMAIEVGGHGYQNFLNPKMEGGTLFDRHPDWFGMDEAGIRNPGEWDGRGRRVFCTSNPDAVDYLTANFVNYIRNHPEIQTFDFWPPDGAVWCECAQCKALGGPSERQIRLLNHVRGAVARVRADLRLEMIAYHRCLTPPKRPTVDRRILVDFCPDAQCFDVQMDDPHAESNSAYVSALKEWRKAFRGEINIYTYYRKYMWRSLPVIIPHYMQKDLQYYQSIPIQGIQCYGEPGDWFTYELNHYVLGQLDWNPSANVDALIRDFCNARYGPASRQAVTALSTLEDVVRRTCNIPMTPLKSVEELSSAHKRLADAHERLSRAQSRITDPAIIRNIDRLALSIRYAMMDVDVQTSRSARAPEAETKRLDAEASAFPAQHAREGVFLQ